MRSKHQYIVKMVATLDLTAILDYCLLSNIKPFMLLAK